MANHFKKQIFLNYINVTYSMISTKYRCSSMNIILFYLLFAVLYTSKAQVQGCTDPAAINFNASATSNDGSCIYAPTTLSPIKSIILSSRLRETSGLCIEQDSIWTHNDDADINLYKCSMNDSGYSAYPMQSLKNTEWEDISNDSAYIYLGDFGNNASGNRKDLHILRIEKSLLMKGIVKADTINFSYEDQVDLNAVPANTTDFDCEAMIVGKDSMYLFTKMWSMQKTTMYSLPKLPGMYKAKKNAQIDSQGLITGACFLEDKRLIILCGYSNLLQPFLLYLYDYPNYNVSQGNKRKVSINLPFHQIEGITTKDGLLLYCSNERFTQSFITIPQALHHIDNSSIIQAYLSRNTTSIESRETSPFISIFPNPGEQSITIQCKSEHIGKPFKIVSYDGKLVFSGILDNDKCTLSVQDYPNGSFIFTIDGMNCYSFTIMH